MVAMIFQQRGIFSRKSGLTMHSPDAASAVGKQRELGKVECISSQGLSMLRGQKPNEASVMANSHGPVSTRNKAKALQTDHTHGQGTQEMKWRSTPVCVGAALMVRDSDPYLQISPVPDPCPDSPAGQPAVARAQGVQRRP